MLNLMLCRILARFVFHGVFELLAIAVFTVTN